jgi:hypothetical protein
MTSDEYDLPADVDEAAIARMRFVATVLDDAVRIPGIGVRVGLDSVLGVAPVAGDVLTGALSLYLVVESARLGVSVSTLLRMIANVGVDTAAGSVPVVGDLFDVFWKANRKNLRLALSDLADGASSPETREAVTIEVE